MVIYGLWVMGLSLVLGNLIGTTLGALVGINGDVGGVGFAMLILVLLTRKLMDKDKLSKTAQSGIQFWNAMYIPIVVAMAANQNVVAALNGGALAFIAGIAAVVVCFAFIPVLSRLGGGSTPAAE